MSMGTRASKHKIVGLCVSQRLGMVMVMPQGAQVHHRCWIDNYLDECQDNYLSSIYDVNCITPVDKYGYEGIET